jgi:adenine-specific DNA-methyltransferase
MGRVTSFAAEHALADLAFRLGAAEVAGLSPAERGLAAAAAAWAAAAGRGAATRTVAAGRQAFPDHMGQASPHGVAGLRDRIRAGEDPLGEAFCRIRTPRQRRRAGQTFTPGPVVDGMVCWAARALTPARVVDPGAGSARFLAAAGRRWPRARLVGMETDPLAALIGRATLAAAGMADRAAIQVADYRTAQLPAAAGPTLFLGNPPYVRHHHVAAPWKDWFRDNAARLGLPASGLAGLHAHFFLATALHAVPGDAGVLVTAAEWLDVNYGSLIRALLLGPLGGESVHLLDPAAAVFPDAAATSAITCFRPGTRPSAIRLRQVPQVAGLGDLAGGTPVPVTVLRAAPRWRPLAVHPSRPRRGCPEGMVELGELCRVHRGQVTGANKVWITAGNGPGPVLPARYLLPAVTHASELFGAGDTLASSAGLRRVIDLPADLGVLSPGERARVDAFLARAREQGAAESYVARHRSPWWRVRMAEPAPILATYMARRPPAFVRNLAAARHVNIAHGLYPRDPLPPATLDNLAAYLRGSVTAAQGRVYAGGLAKFEPREMERLPVPAPSLLDCHPPCDPAPMPRTAQFDRQRLTGLAAKQHGVITRPQALACGMTERVVDYRIRGGGPWTTLLPGVYLTHTGHPDDTAREMATLLYAGPQSVLTGAAALRRHGLSAGQPGGSTRHAYLVDVLVPDGSRRADVAFARLHRTSRLPAPFCVAGEIRFALPPRAVADAVRPMTNLADVRAVVAEAVQRGRCSIQHLAAELDAGTVWGSGLFRRSLAEVAEGMRSAVEGDLHDLIRWARLPTPLYNPHLLVDGEFLAMPDCWWPESGVAGEADSRAWHLSPDHWEKTLARHARMSAHGIIVLHLTPQRIRFRRREVADEIRQALVAGRKLSQITTISADESSALTTGRLR